MPIDELAPDFSNYGALKALCEAEVEHVFGERALIVRPGLIVGPHDPTGRFTYWAPRLGRGGEILAPGPRPRHAQFIDVRDLAEWMLEAVEQRALAAPTTRRARACRGASCSPERMSRGSRTSFSGEHEVGEWMELPLWVADPSWAGCEVDVSRAVGAGCASVRSRR